MTRRSAAEKFSSGYQVYQISESLDRLKRLKIPRGVICHSAGDGRRVEKKRGGVVVVVVVVVGG